MSGHINKGSASRGPHLGVLLCRSSVDEDMYTRLAILAMKSSSHL